MCELYLLLMEKGRLSPGGGRPSPPLLMTEVEKFLVDITARWATWANISGLKYHRGKYRESPGRTEIVQTDEKTVRSEIEAAIIHELNILLM